MQAALLLTVQTLVAGSAEHSALFHFPQERCKGLGQRANIGRFRAFVRVMKLQMISRSAALTPDRRPKVPQESSDLQVSLRQLPALPRAVTVVVGQLAQIIACSPAGIFPQFSLAPSLTVILMLTIALDSAMSASPLLLVFAVSLWVLVRHSKTLRSGSTYHKQKGTLDTPCQPSQPA